MSIHACVSAPLQCTAIRVNERCHYYYYGVGGNEKVMFSPNLICCATSQGTFPAAAFGHILLLDKKTLRCAATHT